MSRALYRLLVHLHPRGFRDRFEDEMLAVYDDAVAAHGGLRLVASTLVSLAGQWLRPSRLHGPAVSADTIRAYEICRTRQRLELVVGCARPAVAVLFPLLLLPSVRSQLTVITVATGAWIAVVYGRTRWKHCRSPEEYERARRHVSGLCEELARRVEKHDAAQHSSEARQWTFMLFLSLVTLVLVAGSPLPDFFGRMAVLCAMGLGLNWLRGHLVNLLRREMEETSPPAD